MEPEQFVQGQFSQAEQKSAYCLGLLPTWSPLRKMEGHWGEKREISQL